MVCAAIFSVCSVGIQGGETCAEFGLEWLWLFVFREKFFGGKFIFYVALAFISVRGNPGVDVPDPMVNFFEVARIAVFRIGLGSVGLQVFALDLKILV
jgi:hypothetical protein